MWGPAGGAAGGPRNTRFRFISHHHRGSILYYIVLGGVLVVIHLHRKSEEKVKTSTCSVWRWCGVLHVFAQVRSDVSYFIFHVTPSLLPLRHRVVGSHQQTKHKKAQTEIRKQTKNNPKKRRNTTCNRYQGSGIRYQVSGIRYQVSGIRYQVSGTQRKKRDQTWKQRKEGTREKIQQPRGGDLSAYKRATAGRKERVKRSNSREGGGDLSANTKMKSIWWVSVL